MTNSVSLGTRIGCPQGFDLALEESQYTLWNASTWGFCFAHLKKFNEPLSMGNRIIHVLIGAVEFIPIIGQIASIAEMYIVTRACASNPPSPPLDEDLQNLLGTVALALLGRKSSNENKYDLVEQCLSRKSDHSREEQGVRLVAAAARGRIEIVAQLLNGGPVISDDHLKEALRLASSRGDEPNNPTIRELLTKKLQENFKRYVDALTPLTNNAGAKAEDFGYVVYLKTTAGKKYEIKVFGDTTIESFKLEFMRRYKVPFPAGSITFNGKQLSDEDTFENSQINKESDLLFTFTLGSSTRQSSFISHQE